MSYAIARQARATFVELLTKYLLHPPPRCVSWHSCARAHPLGIRINPAADSASREAGLGRRGEPDREKRHAGCPFTTERGLLAACMVCPVGDGSSLGQQKEGDICVMVTISSPPPPRQSIYIYSLKNQTMTSVLEMVMILRHCAIGLFCTF